MGAHHDPIFLRRPLDASCDPVCEAGDVPVCTDGNLKGTGRELARALPVPFGDVSVVVGSRRVFGAADGEPTSAHSRSSHARRAWSFDDAEEWSEDHHSAASL